MSSPADAAARRQAAVAAAAQLEPLAGYPAAVVADPLLDQLRATFASQAQSAYQQNSALSVASAAAQFAASTAAATSALVQAGAVLPAGGGGGLHDLLQSLPVAHGLHPGGVAPPTALDGGHKSWGQYRGEVERRTPQEEAAEKSRRAKAEKAQKEAHAAQEAEKTRCHLHKKPKDGCKFCKRRQEYVVKDNEAKAIAKEKFMSAVVGKKGQQGGRHDFSGPLELVASKTYGFPPMLQTHIVESTHFKTLMDFKSIEEILHEISGYADTVEPYAANSATTASALFCCTYRLLTMNITAGQLRRIIESEESAYIRCAGFLFVRFGLAPDQLWSWLGEYILDEEEFRISGRDESIGSTTVGQYVESLLSQERYFSTILPRLPTPIKRQLEAKLSQVPQDRRRSQANQRLLDVYGQRGVRIEANIGDDVWREGETIETIGEESSRPKVRVRFTDRRDSEAEEAVIHLGRVILADSRHGSRSSSSSSRRRSRSRSPSGIDWSREKGKSSAELLEEHRRREQDKAVCSSGKDYAKRPVSFMVALPMEQGVASKGLSSREDRKDETYVSSGEVRGGAGGSAGGAASGRRSDDRDRSRSPRRRWEESIEYQARMKQLFEKYGQAKAPTNEERRRSDVEGPDVMRLG